MRLLKAVKRAFLPALSASGGYSLQNHSDYGSHELSVYAGMNLPNINVVNIKNQVEQGQAYYDIAVNNVEALKKGIYFEVQKYYMQMKQLEKQNPAKK